MILYEGIKYCDLAQLMVAADKGHKLEPTGMWMCTTCGIRVHLDVGSKPAFRECKPITLFID